MTSTTRPAQFAAEQTGRDASAAGPSAQSEITWLLHRTAQRIRSATTEQAAKHGLQLRDQIVLIALDQTPGLTQGELGKALGLDKTTQMSQLDRLKRLGLVIRRNDPGDRRARILEITEAGDTLRSEVAAACRDAEMTVLGNFSADEVQVFRRMLFKIIGDGEERGSCL